MTYRSFAIETSKGRLFRETTKSDPSLFMTREAAEARLAAVPALKASVIELTSGPINGTRKVEGYWVRDEAR